MSFVAMERSAGRAEGETAIGGVAAECVDHAVMGGETGAGVAVGADV